MGKGWRGKKRTGKGKKIARDPLSEQIKKIGRKRELESRRHSRSELKGAHNKGPGKLHPNRQTRDLESSPASI